MSLYSELSRIRSSPVAKTIKTRLEEFHSLGQKPFNEIFKELCFCLLTANYTSEGGIRIQKEIGDNFLTLTQDDLAIKLTSLRYRFPNARAKYIYHAQQQQNSIKETFASNKSTYKLRNWLAENILGLGYKESSHFLRNIGYFDVAIIDFHIIDILVKNKLITKPKSKSLNKTQYFEIEGVLAKLALKLNMTQGELDLYLWYLETGKVLK